MPVLVFSGALRKNQKAPLVYEPCFRTYRNCSKLIDAIFNDAKGKIVVTRDKHVFVPTDARQRPKIVKIKYQ